MEVSNRFNAEADLQKALATVWSEWSKDRNPEDLTVERLTELLESECQDPLWAVWIAANVNVLEEYGQEQDEAALLIAFLAYFNNWKKDVAERWGARVDEYKEKTTISGGGGGGGGSGSGSGLSGGPSTHLPTIGQPISFLDAALAEASDVLRPNQPQPNRLPVFTEGHEPGPSNEPSAEPDEERPPPWAEAKHEILEASDFEREAITTVTQTHTDGETTAAAKVQASGPMLIAIWRTEPNACKVCAPLEGTRPNVWRKVAPNGPTVHPRCRCHLEWVAIEST